ncbi:Aste57867_11565 [Aphanomyces stellatus]|uniref:Aste57867_11565 protein n=1 Tax=Aphanomyces stellatus TaxID=120398 RepID=A0A485KTB8_9STRA|nr:hypothetical protein As57867_011522 [Aphanomyces stellatus]VFT88424.1 Aste57867_11565 [Aphanomyces stellatus]
MSSQLSAAAALLKEVQDAQREVEDARRQYAQAQEALNRAREEHAEAENSKKKSADDVDALAVKLDSALAAVVLRPEYIVEFQANIGCYQCYVHIDLNQSKATPSLRMDPSTGDVQLRTSPEHILMQLALENAVDLQASTLRVHKDHIHARIPLTTAAKNNRKATMTAGMAARSVPRGELDVGSYTELACRSCQASLLANNTTWEKALPLPSANWLEMVDFWGAAEGAFEHIPRDGIQAARGRVYVAPADLLLHASNVANVVAAAKEGEGNAMFVQAACGKCAAPVGSMYKENVRLWKHCIESRAGIFSGYMCDAVLVTQILEVIESDGFFRFDVSDGRENGRHLVLQVLSWDATIQTSECPTPKHVVKVLFGGAKEPDPALPSRPLNCAPDLLEAIFVRLDASAGLLPASMTGLSQLKMGFLFG